MPYEAVDQAHQVRYAVVAYLKQVYVWIRISYPQPPANPFSPSLLTKISGIFFCFAYFGPRINT